MYTGKGRINANGLMLKDYFMRAHAVGKNEVIGGPDWLEADRYEPQRPRTAKPPC